MIGDVSSHGFPAALIMALCLSAASIYALESPHPGEVLRKLDDALSGEAGKRGGRGRRCGP